MTINLEKDLGAIDLLIEDEREIIVKKFKDFNVERKSCIALKTLLSELENLRNAGYIFRGQSNKDFYLQPWAFRSEGIEKLSQNFPPFQREKWFSNEKIKKTAEPYTKYIYYKMGNLIIYIMQYNYSLATYVQENESSFDEDSKKFCAPRPPAYWTKEETFQYLFEQYWLAGIEARDIKKHTILKKGVIYEDLTGIDETLPQHYGIPTAALDWTYDPYVAIYFALPKNILKNNATHFSIHAYKEIHASEKNPILTKHGNHNIENHRIKAQKGVLLYFRKPCSFYLTSKGSWPSIENYLFNPRGNFELIQYIIPMRHYEYLNNLLIEKNITNKTLLLPD